MHFRSTLRRIRQKNDQLSWAEHVAMICRLAVWEHAVKAHPIMGETNGDVIVYVANFARPQNIAPIVRSLLACPSIKRIIVSNNNPACDLEQWFRPTSDRITVLHYDNPQSCLMRYTHLQNIGSPIYLIVDDDVFLLPSQVEHLIAELRTDPAVPHGLVGQRWEDDHFQQGVMYEERTVDALNRIYAFTASHLAELLRLTELMKPADSSKLRAFGWCDDILLSCSVGDKPRIHDCGPIIDCPTQGKQGTAVWREDGFFASREELYKRLLTAQSSP